MDTNDHTLDVVVQPDLSWVWKDEDQLAERAANGVYVPDFAKRVRATAERALEILERRDHPFDGSLAEWMPDAGWAIPRLIEGWNELPATLWPDRRSAYGDAPPA